ncbi:MAG TPA: POTRA domain-containing protein, partial [bacterium]
MYRSIFIVFMAEFYASLGFSQIYLNSEEADESAFMDSIKYQIAKIEIIGNDKTKPDVILRELFFTENERASLVEILAAFKRVQSLTLFNRVKFELVGDSEYSSLLIIVYERWYIFPIPVLYRNERDWRKI